MLADPTTPSDERSASRSDAKDRPVRRRADAQRNVEAIIEAAAELLAGNPSASMAEIADASGLVRATVYRHFPSRDDLLRAILRRALDEAGEAITNAELHRGTALEAMRRLIAGLIDVGRHFQIVVDQPIHDPAAMARGAEIGAPIVELVIRGQREGDLRDDMPAAWLAAAMASISTEATRAVGRGEIAPEQAAELAATTFLEPVRLHE